MTAYVVFTKERTIDPAEFATYAEMAPEAQKGHPVTMLARYGAYEVLEGEPIEGAVIIGFPSMEDAKQWYDSPAYQAAAQHRFAGARYSAFIVEGLSQAPT